MTLTIREALPADYAQAGAATAKAYEPFMDMGSPSQQNYPAVVADLAARAGSHVLFVAEYDGKLIGSTSLAVASHQPVEPGAAHIRMLGVAPEYQGVGAGQALVTACIDHSRSAGKKTIGLRTMKRMKKALHLYNKLGFIRDPAQDYDDKEWGTFLAYRLSL